MENKLTAKRRKKLIHLHRKERDGRVRDRIKAVLAFDEGYSSLEIGRILLLDDETIRRHVEDYFATKKLKPENGGSESYLSTSESVKLKAHLEEKTYLYVKDIVVYIKKEFKKSYSISGLRKWLHANNFRYKKPHGVPAKADKVRQEEFINTYKELKQGAGNKAPIYFVDSVHPQHQTRLAYGWILKGERKAVAMTGRQYRLNIMGGICLNGHKVVSQQSEKVDAQSIQSFLRELRRHHPSASTLHVIWDNAGYHRSKAVMAYADELKIKLHYLPPYSPNLNPIERLWKIMHEQVTYNRYHEKFSDFTEAILYFFRHIGKKKTILRSRITDNFQTLTMPKFAS